MFHLVTGFGLLFIDGNINVGVVTELIEEVKQLKEQNTVLTQEITQHKETMVELKGNNTGLTQDIEAIKGIIC